MRKHFFFLIFLSNSLLFAQINGLSKDKVVPIDSSQQIADVIVKSPIPVFIDFWAPWCGPCRYLTPIVKELEEQYKGKVLFLKVNVDIHVAIAQYFKITAIPSIYILYNKTAVNKLQGVQSKEAYIKAIEDVIAESSAKPAKPESVISPQ